MPVVPLPNMASPQGGPDLFLKSLAVGAPQMIQEQLSGLGATDLASSVGKLINPKWQQEVAKAASGPLTEGSTWSANIGMSLPVLAEALLLRRVGAPLGTIGTVGLPGAAFVAQGKGAAQDALNAYGVDKDIAEKHATTAGLLNGAIAEAQFSQKLMPIKLLPGFLSKTIESSPLLMKAAKELGVNSLMGIEQSGMSLVNDFATKRAFEEMRQRHGIDWQPSVPYETPDYLQQAIIGSGVGAATRTGLTVASIPFNIRSNIKRAAEVGREFNKGSFSRMSEGNLRIEQPKPEIEVMPGMTVHQKWLEQMASQYGPQRLDELVTTASPDDIVTLANKIREKAGQPLLPEGVDYRVAQGEVKAGFNLVQEGPTWNGVGAGKTPLLKPIQLDKTNRQDVLWGNNVGIMADKTIKLTTPPEGFQTSIDLIKKAGLAEAGIDPELAATPELLRPELSMQDWMNSMANNLTRRQFYSMSNAVEGLSRDMLSVKAGHDATNQANAMLYSGTLKLPDILDVKGNNITAPKPDSINTIGLMLASWGLRPFARFVDSVDRAGKFSLASVDAALMQGRNVEQQTYANVKAAHEHIWADVPKEWGRGVQRRALNNLAFWLINSPETRSLKKEQFGISDVANGGEEIALASKVISNGKLKDTTPQQIIDKMKDVVKRYGILSDWAARQAEIPPDRMLEHYFPMYHEYITTGAEEKGISMDQFIRSKEEYFKRINQIGDMEKVINIGDIARSLEQKGYTNLAQGTPAYEFQRAQDREFLRLVTTETDPHKQWDIYMRRMIKKRVYENMAPAVQAAISNIIKSTEATGKPGIRESMKSALQDYLNSAMGMPELQVSVARRLNLRSDNYMVGRIINNGLEFLQKHFGHLHDFSGAVTPATITDRALSMMYPMMLGIPMNLKAPLENVMSQVPMASVFGYNSLVRGMAHLMDTKDRSYADEIKAMNLHGITQETDVNHILSHKKWMSDAMMLPFAASDVWGRQAAASAALYNWKQLEPVLAKDPNLKMLSMEEVSKILFQGKTPKQLGIDDRQILSEGRSLRELWKEGDVKAWHGIERTVYDLLQKGDLASAKDYYVRYGVDLANFRYGRAGTPKLLGGLLKPFLMFSSYPINWLEWQVMMADPKNGVLRNYAATMLTQLLITGIISSLGMSALRMGGVGPFPSKIGFSGPITDLTNSLLNTISTTGVAGQAAIVPGVNQQEQDKAYKRMQAAWDKLANDSLNIVM